MMEFFEALKNDFDKMFGAPIYIGKNTVTTLNIIVWSLFISFFVAVIIMLYKEFVTAALVRELMRKKAFSESSAVALSDIDCPKPLVKFSLKSSSTLRKIVCAAGDGQVSDTAVDADKLKLYIPQKSAKKAETIYGKKNINILNILISVIAVFIVALLALYFIPHIIQLLSNFVSGLSGNGEIH